MACFDLNQPASSVGEDDDVSVSNSVECLGGAMVDNFVDVAVSSSNNTECDSNVVHYDNSSFKDYEDKFLKIKP
ncbi:hypothetical protein Tco_0615457 [Tanacetum coccineum]